VPRAVLAAVVVLFFSPQIYWGVMVGVLMGLAHFLYLRLHPRIIEVGLHPDGSFRDRHLWKLPTIGEKVFALRMDGALDFASASAFERALVEHVAARPDTQHVVLFAHPINRVDATGVEVFVQLRNMLVERGIALHISGIKLPVERVLQRAGALEPGPLLHLYRTDDDAMRALAQQDTIQPSSGSTSTGSP
jgi:SulP family sulfate permease